MLTNNQNWRKVNNKTITSKYFKNNTKGVCKYFSEFYKSKPIKQQNKYLNKYQDNDRW